MALTSVAKNICIAIYKNVAWAALAHYTKYLFECARVPGDLGIIGRDPNLVFFKSNRSHVDIFHFLFINLRYILHIPLKCSRGNYLEVLVGSYVTSGRFSMFIGVCRVG